MCLSIQQSKELLLWATPMSKTSQCNQKAQKPSSAGKRQPCRPCCQHQLDSSGSFSSVGCGPSACEGPGAVQTTAGHSFQSVCCCFHSGSCSKSRNRKARPKTAPSGIRASRASHTLYSQDSELGKQPSASSCRCCNDALACLGPLSVVKVKACFSSRPKSAMNVCSHNLDINRPQSADEISWKTCMPIYCHRDSPNFISPECLWYQAKHEKCASPLVVQSQITPAKFVSIAVPAKLHSRNNSYSRPCTAHSGISNDAGLDEYPLAQRSHSDQLEENPMHGSEPTVEVGSLGPDFDGESVKYSGLKVDRGRRVGDCERERTSNHGDFRKERRFSQTPPTMQARSTDTHPGRIPKVGSDLLIIENVSRSSVDRQLAVFIVEEKTGLFADLHEPEHENVERVVFHSVSVCPADIEVLWGSTVTLTVDYDKDRHLLDDIASRSVSSMRNALVKSPSESKTVSFSPTTPSGTDLNMPGDAPKGTRLTERGLLHAMADQLDEKFPEPVFISVEEGSYRLYEPKDLLTVERERLEQRQQEAKFAELAHQPYVTVRAMTGVRAADKKTQTRTDKLHVHESPLLATHALHIQEAMKRVLHEESNQHQSLKPWLRGQRSLSKQTARFNLPVDLRELELMTPLEYLLDHCTVAHRRQSFYVLAFHRFDKDRDEVLSLQEVLLALEHVHGNLISSKELDAVREVLNLDENVRYNKRVFSVISAFSERLVLYNRRHCGRINGNEEPGDRKMLVEKADFGSLLSKLSGVQITPSMRSLFQVL